MLTDKKKSKFVIVFGLCLALGIIVLFVQVIINSRNAKVYNDFSEKLKIKLRNIASSLEVDDQKILTQELPFEANQCVVTVGYTQKIDVNKLLTLGVSPNAAKAISRREFFLEGSFIIWIDGDEIVFVTRVFNMEPSKPLMVADIGDAIKFTIKRELPKDYDNHEDSNVNQKEYSWLVLTEIK